MVEEATEAQNQVEDVVEERVKKTDEVLERTKSDAQKIAQEAGILTKPVSYPDRLVIK